MAKYSTYIELDPRYESVVDLTSEDRHPNLWHDYIVHDDMAKALEKICESIKNEDKDKRRSFWIHGTYGTGKSYSALVLKHLFEDDITAITPFFNKEKISQYKRKFLGIREGKEYMVVWRSGVSEISSGTQLLMAAEMAIVEQLKKKYGDKAYLGTKSILGIAKQKLNDKKINWDAIFDDPTNGLSDSANSMYEIRELIEKEDKLGKIDTISLVANIIRNNGWALMSTVEDFERWVKDIIEHNGKLKTGGIFFIWDEFTNYLKNQADGNVLQRLSELCKVTPLFMAFLVHKDATLISNISEDEYNKISHRYHELEFNISQDAAYVLIGETIRPRAGMETETWPSIRDKALKGITITDFADLSNTATQLRTQIEKVFPIHPMTLKLLTTVVQNFAASERTLFRFMKDPEGITAKVGFPYFIDTFSDEDWAWLTSDFLWDYFFMRSSDLRETGSEAAKAYRHYKKVVEEDHMIGKDDVNSEALAVFKASMLLISIMGTSKINLRSRAMDHRMLATRKTLYLCFQGQLAKERIDNILQGFKDTGLLRLDEMHGRNDARLELPYTSTAGDLFESRLAAYKQKHTRYTLFGKGAAFSSAVEDVLWEKSRATYRRLQIACASNETNSINARRKDIVKELEKSPYKIGILIVAISDSQEFPALQEKLRDIAFRDTTRRLFVCAMRESLAEKKLEEFYAAKTHAELAREESKSDSANSKEDEAAIIMQTWATSATGGLIVAYYRDKEFLGIQSRDKLRKIVEDEVIFDVFKYAPERIVTQETAFKPAKENTAFEAILPDKVKSNSQVLNIAEGLKSCHVYNAATLSDIENADGTPAAKAIAKLAKAVREELSNGATKVLLDALWIKLQSPPFGLYNTLASAYLLGFILKHYVGGEYHWWDGSNPHQLSPENANQMIYKLCKGETSGNYLSSGTEAWRRFKSYVQLIFGISDSEAANEEEARKHVRAKITERGTPFWVLKWVDADKFGGESFKAAAEKVICGITDFVLENGKQEDVMTNVVAAFKGFGPIKNALRDIYSDRSTCYEALICYVDDKNSEIKATREAIGLTRNEFFDALRQAMQATVWSWEENDVISKLDEIVLDFRIVDILNNGLVIKGKTISSISTILLNKLDNMKVPGKVVESLNYDFKAALIILHDIATGRSSNLSTVDKKRYIDELSAGAKDAWSRLSAEKTTIKDYLKSKGYAYTDYEIDKIFSALKSHRYDHNITLFETEIGEHISLIEDARRKEEIKRIWLDKSGYVTVTEWCNANAVSVLWVVRNENNAHDAFRIIRSIQNKNLLAADEIKRALEFLQNANLDVLRNETAIQEAFFREVGEKYRRIFATKRDTIVSRLRNGVTSDVFEWAMRVGEIQKIIDGLLREEGAIVREKVRENLQKMESNSMQKRILKLLEDYPELYEYFLGDSAK